MLTAVLTAVLTGALTGTLTGTLAGVSPTVATATAPIPPLIGRWRRSPPAAAPAHAGT